MRTFLPLFLASLINVNCCFGQSVTLCTLDLIWLSCKILIDLHIVSRWSRDTSITWTLLYMHQRMLHRVTVARVKIKFWEIILFTFYESSSFFILSLLPLLSLFFLPMSEESFHFYWHLSSSSLSLPLTWFMVTSLVIVQLLPPSYSEFYWWKQSPSQSNWYSERSTRNAK